MSNQIDWIELIKDRKGVITKDNQSCGNIIGDDEENFNNRGWCSASTLLHGSQISGRNLQWC